MDDSNSEFVIKVKSFYLRRTFGVISQDGNAIRLQTPLTNAQEVKIILLRDHQSLSRIKLTRNISQKSSDTDKISLN